jgi:hypothetical protein
VAFPLPAPVNESASILSPRVRRAQYELIAALCESIQGSGLTREMAEAKLSALMADVWTELEAVVMRLPHRAGQRWPRDIEQRKPNDGRLHNKKQINPRSRRRGAIRWRGKDYRGVDCWYLRVYIGRGEGGRRHYKCETFYGGKREAQRRLEEMLALYKCRSPGRPHRRAPALVEI